MKRILLAAIVPLLFAGCVTHPDLRTQAELDRGSELWTRAHAVRVAIDPEQFRDCSLLGVVSEQSYDGPPGDPAKRPMGSAWPEYVLRFKTAQLGGNAALVCAPIRKWTGQLSESRVLGEAYLCGGPARTTASRGFWKMIAPFLSAAIITRAPVVAVKPPARVTDSWLCSHVSVFFCSIFPKLGESVTPSPRRVVPPRKP
jgi:hypothetical protein